MQAKRNNSGITDPRELALNIVYEVMEKGAYANISLDKALRSSALNPNDKNLVTEIVNGSVRMIKHLDWVLNLFLKTPIKKQNPWLRNILRISAYQLLFMERIPDYAAVNSAVELCRKKSSRALAGVCNGVLRNMIRNQSSLSYPPEDSLDYLAVYYSQPEWLVAEWVEVFGRETAVGIFEYLNQRAPLYLRVNALKTSPSQLLEDLKQEGITARPSLLIPWSVKIENMEKSLEESGSYQSGHFYIQNEASMLAGAILDPQPGEKILDLCCGVGGKTTHFAEIMKNLGSIDAVDLYEHKLKLLKINCRRLGINNVKPLQTDILSLDARDSIWQRVFLDAPCSGLGVLNRRSDSRWKKKPQEIQDLDQLQQALLHKAASMTAPGGVLVYSTCTINPFENELLIKKFLSANPDFSLKPFTDLIKFFPLDENDRNNADNGLLTLLPGKYGTDGMFYACLKRS